MNQRGPFAMFPRLTWVFAAVLVAVALLATAAVWTARRDHPASTRQYPVIVVEERRLAEAGQTVPQTLKDRARRVAPTEQIQWGDLELLDADDVAGMRALLQRRPAKVVVLLNENLVAALGDAPLPASFIVASELPPATLRARFNAVRAKHHVSFLSWYADNHGKLLDHLRLFEGPPIRVVAGLYHTSLMNAGVAAGLADAAAARGMKTLLLQYDSMEDLQTALDRAKGDADALFIPVSEGINRHLEEVADRVARTGMLAAYTRGDQVESGGLVSVDAPTEEIYDQIARYALLILHGADASQLDITQPTRLETSINLTAADRIHRLVPYELLVEASWVHQ